MLLPCFLIYFVGKKIQQVRIFGLTGGIASGKTTLVSMMTETLHDEIYVIDCDLINR
jgi:dephospho-CoA kinase